MDLKELKKQVDKITQELKTKASGELSSLIETQSILINVMLEMSSGILAQNERLTATVTDLQTEGYLSAEKRDMLLKQL